MQIDDKVYDKLKWALLIFVPAFITLYTAIDGILKSSGYPGLFDPTVVTGIIAAVATFLGAILGISGSSYSGDGTLKVDNSQTGDKKYRLDLDTDFASLANKKKFVVTVDSNADLSSK